MYQPPLQLEFADMAAINKHCEEQRAAGINGFLVRADTQEDAIRKREKAPLLPTEYYIL